MKSRGLSQPVVIALIVVGFLLAGVGAYMMLIRPQHAKAADLDRQIADTNSAIDAARALTLEANRERQAQITQELSEIVGGANALTDAK